MEWDKFLYWKEFLAIINSKIVFSDVHMVAFQFYSLSAYEGDVKSEVNVISRFRKSWVKWMKKKQKKNKNRNEREKPAIVRRSWWTSKRFVIQWDYQFRFKSKLLTQFIWCVCFFSLNLPLFDLNRNANVEKKDRQINTKTKIWRIRRRKKKHYVTLAVDCKSF